MAMCNPKDYFDGYIKFISQLSGNKRKRETDATSSEIKPVNNEPKLPIIFERDLCVDVTHQQLNYDNDECDAVAEHYPHDNFGDLGNNDLFGNRRKKQKLD